MMPTDPGSLRAIPKTGPIAVLASLLLVLGAGVSAGQTIPPDTVTARVLRRGDPTINSPAHRTRKELDDAATPIVDANALLFTADVARRQKNVLHDNQRIVQSEAPPEGAEITVDSETPIASEFPVAQSDLIVEAKVTRSQAFLSEDRTGVYSEFSVSVSEILKASAGSAVKRGAELTTERFGGRVRYPSGQVVRYRTASEGSPMIGKTYVLFLKRTQGGNYRILTAYALGTRVQALDGSRVKVGGRGASIFDRRNGQDLETFQQDLENAIEEVHP
jgi:hypothetical protein